MNDHGSTVGNGQTFDKNFFEGEGVVFLNNGGISLVQGRLALITGQGIDGYFTELTKNIAVSVAPYVQGTWNYILHAYNENGLLVASNSKVVTQDLLDPENTGFGYIDMSIGSAEYIESFAVRSEFVRTSYTNTSTSGNTFGLSALIFERTSISQVPLPGTFSLLTAGLLCLGFAHRKLLSERPT